jgi:SAM-dependent methyltransferase
MDVLYDDGSYLKNTVTWHVEDSPWKAGKVLRMLERHQLKPRTIADIGCGAGEVLRNMERSPLLRDTVFHGYDISPQAIGMAAMRAGPRLRFHQENLLVADPELHFDLLMAIDVFEHVRDYMGFIEQCKGRAHYKVFHIPLDLHVSGMLRNAFVKGRYTIGHLHYFNADSALSTLRDCGHEILDVEYTDGCLALFRQHPSLKKAAANIPRWLLSRVNVPLAAHLLGGYSLLVLTR